MYCGRKDWKAKLKKVVFCICMAALLFGTMEVALKIGGSNVDEVQLTFLRFLLGGLMLVPFAAMEWNKRKAAGRRIEKRDWLWVGLVGVVGIPISMLSFQFGVMGCNASTASSIICLNALFTMVIARIFLKEEMTKAKWLAFAIGLIAAVFMIRPWDIQAGNTPGGLFFMMTAAVTFAAYTVMGKVTIEKVGLFTQTSISFLVGSFVLWLIILFRGGPVIEGIAENWKVILYTGIFVTGLGYMFYFMAIEYSDAITGSITFFVKPIIAPILALIFLHEKILCNTVLAVILLMTASFINLRTSKKRIKEES